MSSNATITMFTRNNHPVLNFIEVGEMKKGHKWMLIAPDTEGGYRATVTITALPDRPDLVGVRGFNWKCEDEPSGAYKIDAARQLFRDLVRQGFSKKTVE